MPGPARAVVRGRANPRSDPRYQKVIAKLNTDSRRVKQHPPASKKAKEPEKAARGPPNEKAAGARVNQVDKLQSAETPPAKPASFLEMLQAQIAKVTPKTLGDTEKFMKGGAGNEMKSSLQGSVAKEKDKATGDLQQTSNEAPSESGVPTKPVEPIPGEAAPPAPTVDAPGAMPAPKPAAEISLQSSKTDVQNELDKEKVTDQRLQKANDPRFSAALGAKQAVHKQADAGPGKYRASEAGTLAQAAAKAMDVARKGVTLLLGVKSGSKAKMLSRQDQQKAKEEQELKAFTDFVVATFNTTKAQVDKRLELLDTRVNEMFDAGVDTAVRNMKEYVDDELMKYKLKRYLLRPFGLVLWVKDQFMDLPSEVNQFYEQGRARFTKEMNALAAQVAGLVESQLAAAKDDVKRGQAAIAARQARLSPGVQARAAQVTAEFAGKFTELESGIDDKKNQLAESLAQKYKDAFDKADETLKQIQEENKGLVAQAIDKIGSVIKAIIEFKNRLMSILKKGKETLDLILDDPIRFLSNLLNAIKAGFRRFVDNIWEHLKSGFMKWLFGALASTGIELPKDLSIISILKLVLGVLGITYERMRAKAVKLLGEAAVTAIEKLVGYVKALIEGGPAKLWEEIKSDLSNLKEMVIGAIQDWLITTIVRKAVEKIVSMFNPAGAIVQAVIMIYNVVMFVIERAAQILDFVEAVINSLYKIATGAIDSAAQWIEKALANMIPIVIGLLASLIGLGGISQKIRDFITKVQSKVDKAIDKVLARLVGVVKKLFGALKAGAKKLMEWWKMRKRISGGGETHELSFQGDQKKPRLMMASDPQLLKTFLAQVQKKNPTPGQVEAIGSINTSIGIIEGELAKAEGARNADAISGAFEAIGAPLTKLFSLVKDGTVKGLRIGRPAGFTADVASALNPHGINLRDAKLDRRHVVSSKDIAEHFEVVLNEKKWTAAMKILTTKGQTVATPLDQPKIQEAAKTRHTGFFNDLKNLFLGGSSENRSLGRKLDRGRPGATESAIAAHIEYIKKRWALDPGNLRITGWNT